jgi:hypothetical protein
MSVEMATASASYIAGQDLTARAGCAVQLYNDMVNNVSRLGLANTGGGMLGILADKPGIGDAGRVVIGGICPAVINTGGNPFLPGAALQVGANGQLTTKVGGITVAYSYEAIPLGTVTVVASVQIVGAAPF